MNREDQVNHMLGVIKERIDSHPEKWREIFYGILLNDLYAFLWAVDLGEKALREYVAIQSTVNATMNKFIIEAGELEDG